MLGMLLFSLWFKDLHATRLWITTDNHFHKMPAEYIFLNRMTVLHAF